MGGLSGHMMHPFDNMELTKSDLKQIIASSLNDELKMTEKVDGFNIHAYMVNGEVRFARNRKDLENGGMTIADMIDKWENNPYTLNIYLKSAFLIKKYLNEAQLESVTSSIITLNCECVVGETNIMPYPDARVYIHNAWIWHKDGTVEVSQLGPKYKCINVDNVYFEQPIHINPPHNVNGIINGYCDDIDDMFEENNTIKEYYQTKFLYWLYNNCQWVLESNEGIKALFYRFFANDKSVNLKQIKSMYPGKESLIDELCKREYKYCLEWCKGELKFFIYNVGNTILSQASNYINEKQRYTVCQHLLDQLGDYTLYVLDNKVNALEGVVFEWKGNLYKWTGSFAIINKILGEKKYEKLV